MWPFVRRSRLAPVEHLHESIAALSRDRALFTEFGVADTFEGRFELLTLHLALVLRRLSQLPPPAADIAQDLTDLSFQRLDEALREIGIGDLGVPKRMKILAKAFFGRATAYGAALDAGNRAELVESLRRNVLDGGEGDAEALAARAEAFERRLSRLTLETILESGPQGLDPSEAAAGGAR
jgi:cytochrome b pre-mRNA-processing protein 3